jgi:histidinol dehydrogenase
MKTLHHPTPEAFLAATRPDGPALNTHLRNQVQHVLQEVRQRGDVAVQEYTARFDGWAATASELPTTEWHTLADACPIPLREAIHTAAANIRVFHATQLQPPAAMETQPGVRCWYEYRPLQRVGLYVPGGSAPLVSTVLMLAVPAALAGCPEVVLCTPPDSSGSIHPAIAYAAQYAGVHRVFRIGGAQAIAALAYGTETVPAVDKLFGPGNQYVTAAKQLVQAEGIAIDLPAGPSEVLVIADDAANPTVVAADLLAQCEHGPDSQAMLISDSAKLLEVVQTEVLLQVQTLPRAAIAAKALDNSWAVWVPSLPEGLQLSNLYAPEHLILNTREPEALCPLVQHAGSVFLGPHSAEALGDYASGPNHTLPTSGYARAYSGLSLNSFRKQVSFQAVTQQGLQALAPTVLTLARTEELEAHAQAVTLRLKTFHSPEA